MTDRVLSDAEIEKMETPVWEQAKAAIDAGDAETAKALIDRAVDAVGEPEGLLDQLDHERCSRSSPRSSARRRSSGRCARPATSSSARAAPPAPTGATLPAAQRAKVIARAMVANMGEVEVTEDDEKIVLVVPVRHAAAS